jgi:hypothetical protein
LPHDRVEMESLCSRAALPRGRGDRVPPRKPAFAPSPGFPSEATSLWIASPGGAGSARPRGGLALDRGMCPVGQPASCLMIGWKWNASARVRPCNADARSASLRENRLSRHLRVSPARPPHFASPLLEGRAPHARKGGTGLTEGCARYANRPLASSPGGNGIPLLACGLATRTRRARPSEKTAFRASPGLPPEGLLPIAWPSRGGAGSARPQGGLALDRGMCPVGQPASCLMIGWKWNASARVRPCNADAQSASLRENRLSRHLRVSPARPPHFGSPLLEGRAPHGRK